MSSTTKLLYSDVLLEVLSLSQNATAVYTSEDIIIQTANDAMLKFWEKDRSIIGLPMEIAIPELKGQPFIGILQNVWNTGITYEAKNTPAELFVNGKLETLYFDFIYRAIKNTDGRVYCILHTATDVTERIKAARNQEKAEDMLRVAIESAKLGTWFIDITTKEFIPSARLKELLGYYADEEMPYRATMNQVVGEYKNQVRASLEAAILNGSVCEMEYPVIGYHDQKLRWVRVTGRLYEGPDGIKSNFSGTMFDITDQKMEEQRKDDFISIASHELKTPITSLKASLQLLDRMKDKPSAAMMPRLVLQANKSMDRISSLVDDLLNSTRMTEGQLHLNKTKFNIAQMLNECCSHIRINDTHQLILKGDEHLQVTADEHRIEQVVVNFVNNAVKYAPDCKEIFLIIERQGNIAKVSVKDNGPGIASDKIPHLFDRYYRADYAGIQYSGLGLGLYICAQIIKRHGGEIGIESKLGTGSTFWFTLPLN